MEKMKNIYRKFYKILLSRKVKKHEFDISYLKSYLYIYESILVEKDDDKVSKLKEKQFNFLKKLEITSLSNEDYLAYQIQNKASKILKKYYWKNRALKQTSIRKISKTTNQKVIDEINNNLEVKINENNVKAELAKTGLINKNKRNFSEMKINENLETYEFELIKSKSNIEILRDKLMNVRNDKVSKFHTKQHAIISKKEKKLDRLKGKYEKLKLVENQNHHLDEGDILSIRNLTMNFGGLKAIDDLTLSVKKGEIFGLIGPNGAGKTTVFNCITQFYKATEGTIEYKNKLGEIISLNNLPVHNVISEGIARTFQNVELVWELNVMDNMLVGSHSSYHSNLFSHMLHTRKIKREEKIAYDKAEKILSDLGILEYKYIYPLGLPYGILKKIEFARTLMTDPNLIILDEPAAGLNDRETQDLSDTIKKIRDDYKCTIFLVEHDMGLVMDVCDRVCAISFGKKLALGTPEEIQNNKAVRDAYLGGD